MDILTLLDEDEGLWAAQYHVVSPPDLPICTWVGDRSPVHTNDISSQKSRNLSLVN
jgi:hypothetical protein